MSCLNPSAMQRHCQDLREPYQLAPILQLTDKTLIFSEGHRAKATGLTGRTLFGIEDVSRSSSVRASSLPVYASCIRQPRPHASTAQGGPCCTACQSAFPTCMKTSSQHRFKEQQEDCRRYQKALKGLPASWHELHPVDCRKLLLRCVVTSQALILLTSAGLYCAPTIQVAAMSGHSKPVAG